MAELAARLFDPWALLLVLGGTLLTAMLSATREDMARALAAIAPLLRARPAADARAAACALHDVERITELKGVACADHVQTDSAFVRRACLHLADAPSAEAFAQWAHEEMDARTARHQAAVAVWRSAADAAPAAVQIPHQVSSVVARSVDLDVHDRSRAIRDAAVIRSPSYCRDHAVTLASW